MKLVKPFKAPEPEDEEFCFGDEKPICSVCNQKIELGEELTVKVVGKLHFDHEYKYYHLGKIPISATHTRCEE